MSRRRRVRKAEFAGLSVMPGGPIRVMVFVRHAHITGISAINYYRAIAPLSFLGLNDDSFFVEILGQAEIRQAMQSNADSALLGRHLYLTSRLFAGSLGRSEFIDAIHRHGGKVIFDTDDDLTDAHRELGRGGDFKGILQDVDYVTVSTPHLAKELAPLSACPPWVLPNHVDAEWFGEQSLQAKRTVKGLTVGLIGTASHYDDWSYPLEALRRVATENRNVTIVAAGYCPDYLKGLDNLVELGPVPYVGYPGLMRQFDVVCCSLDAEDGFNKSKSSIKALEAMAAARTLSKGQIGGAVPVCTNMPVYRRTVNNRHNGLLVKNDQWYEGLSLLVKNKRLREKIAAQGLNWVTAHRNIRTGYRRWGKAYRQMVEGV